MDNNTVFAGMIFIVLAGALGCIVVNAISFYKTSNYIKDFFNKK